MAIPIESSAQVKSGATLDAASGGTIDATEINGVPIPATGSSVAGKIPITQGDGSAAWADPLVQGVYPAGSSITSPLINPVLIGGSDYAGSPALQNLKVDSSGQIYIGNAITVSGTVTADQGTSPWVTADEHITATLNQDGFGNVGVNIENSITGTVDVGTVSGTVTVVPQVSPPVSFPVSGTVTANQGTATASAKWSVQVDNSSAIAVSGTVSTTPPSHASTNVDQWNGNTVDTNSGNKSGGTLRVVLATDQPNLTTALNVHDPSPSSVAVTNTGTFAVQAACTGTVSANCSQTTSPWVVSNGGTFAVQEATLDGCISSSIVAVHDASPASQAVTNAGTFAVQAACTGTVTVSGTATVTPAGSTIWEVSPTSSANAVGNPFYNAITDGTNKAAVKAASVAATAADPALVVTTNGSTTTGACANTSVTSTTSAVLAANVARREVIITNTDIVTVYLGLGQTPTATAYHAALMPCTTAHDGSGGIFVSDAWKGAINAIVASTSGHCSIVEMT